MPQDAKCECQRCGNSIEFPVDLHNTEVECPHCHKATTLLAPSATSRIRKTETTPVTAPPAVAGSTIGCSYALCFLIPIAGFFAGIYLLAKKQAGHGAACMALSVIIAIIYLALIMGG